MNINTLSLEQAVDIADWRRDEEFAQYPEGARDKTLVYCPSHAEIPFLPNHHYLFKRSSKRAPEQFWMEIIAYHLGLQMDIPVPPAFPAFDSQMNQSGALIEWFVFPDATTTQTYIAGGDLCQQYFPSFDRKKGKQHNFELIIQIFEDLSSKYRFLNDNWHEYWAKAFVFDALIANTDRHQDNWGIIERTYLEEEDSKDIRISPVFDNGTSMGYNILPDKFKSFEDEKKLEKFFVDGWHHMKWSWQEDHHMGHGELLRKLSERFPETHRIMANCLGRIDFQVIEAVLQRLVRLELPVKLSAERAAFVLRLLQFRCKRLLQELEMQICNL